MQQRIDAWNSDKLPIYEPGLDDVVKECRNRNLFFSTDTHKHVGEADIVFVRSATTLSVLHQEQFHLGERPSQEKHACEAHDSVLDGEWGGFQWC